MEARVHPFREFVLKLAGECNLACTYCYVYEMADTTWQRRPALMSDTVLGVTYARISEHVHRHRLRHIAVIFHGGEPMLAGASRIASAAQRIRDLLPDVDVEIAIQTNGTLMTHDALRLLTEHDIRIGVSLDGDAASHDRHRLRRNGSGSHSLVVRGLSTLTSTEHRRMFSGLLCTIDIANDPIAVYEGLLAWSPPRVDFLLPHGNWDAPPPGLGPSPGGTPYAHWLIAVFDRWYDAPHRATSVRLFEELIHAWLGGKSGTEQLGLSPAAHVVIDTDGSLEQVDSLRSAYDGAAATGLNVHDSSFDEALSHPDIVARQAGLASLAQECRSCGIVRVCGGGNYAHRYKSGSDFRNPSIYCDDLKMFIGHVTRRVAADLNRLRERR